MLAAAQAQGADLDSLLVQRFGSSMTPFDRQATLPAQIEPYGWALGQILGRIHQQRQDQAQRTYQASILGQSSVQR